MMSRGDGHDRDERELPQPSRERWELLRAGIHNVWEYDDQRFVFRRGRLLLRGRNETGKSKALEVLLPFLLDADLSPSRLDPFGSTSRQMRWNLIDGRPGGGEIHLGYLWLELGRRSGQERLEYLTLGAGLKARRSSPQVDAWFFVTSRRVDDDLELVDSGRVPVSRRRLEEALGDDGTVYTRRSDYRGAVNRRLFEMPPSQYDALVSMLLLLRRPQLSKQLDTEGLSRLLQGSLPPLDAGVLGKLAEGFERLERDRAQREAWADTLASVTKFLDVYRGYAKVLGKARAKAITEADSAYHKARADVRAARETLGELERQAETLEAADRDLAMRRADADARLREIRESREFRAAADLDRAEAEARRLEAACARAERELERHRDKLSRQQAACDAEEERLARAESDRQRARADAEAAARSAALADGHRPIDALAGAGEVDALRGAIRALVSRRNQGIDAVAPLARAADENKAQVARRRERREEAEAEERGAREALETAETAQADIVAGIEDAAASWRSDLEVLAFEHADVSAVLAAPPETWPAELRARAEPQRAALDGGVDEAAAAAERISEQLDEARAERDALAHAPHAAPAAAPWRAQRDPDRPGAPLYLLCDFAPSVPERDAASLEAALEASCLLDAWVMPDGQVLGPEIRDAFLTEGGSGGQGGGGATLAAALVPTPTGGVPDSVVRRIFDAVQLAGEGESMRAPAWIARDGRFRVGPLEGAHEKPRAEYIGETARRETRARRLAALETLIAELEAELASAGARLEEAKVRRRALDAEVARFPSAAPLVRAAAEVDAAARAHASARSRREEADRRLAAAEEQHAAAETRRDAAASEHGLTGWAANLDELRAHTARYREAATDLAGAASRVQDARDRALAERERRKVAEAEVAEAADESGRAQQEASAARARADERRASIGKQAQEVQRRAEQLERNLEDLESERRRTEVARRRVSQDLGAAKGALETAEVKEQDADQARGDAAEAMRALAGIGVFAALGAELPDVPARWSFTDSLLAARAIQEAAGAGHFDQAAQDRAENRVIERHRELDRSLTAGVRIAPRREAGVLVYDAGFHGRTLALTDLRVELETQVAESDRLLGEHERELFESFLSGETHEHLQARLRDARALVDQIAGEIRARPTPSGMKLDLRWEIAPDAPPGADRAIDLMLKSGALLTEAHRASLAAFLRQRLDEARAGEGTGSLTERMQAALDYRAWFRFVVLVRGADGGWKPLTRKTHGAGSGGQKAVMLHLPLFAAAAAFYASAAAGSPRLILLDEAFAGIDKPMRGDLMGLLAAFDLDFMMTSHEEWGFYEQLDGLATYQLVRDPGMPGVYAERFLWDGASVRELGAA